MYELISKLIQVESKRLHVIWMCFDCAMNMFMTRNAHLNATLGDCGYNWKVKTASWDLDWIRTKCDRWCGINGRSSEASWIYRHIALKTRQTRVFDAFSVSINDQLFTTRSMCLNMVMIVLNVVDEMQKTPGGYGYYCGCKMCPKTRSIWRFFVHFVIKKWPKKADLAAIGCAQWELLACQISARSDDFCILKGVGLRAVWFLSIPRSDLDYPVDLVYIFTSKGRVTRVDGGFRNPTIWNVDHAQTHLPAGGGFSVESRVFDTTTSFYTTLGFGLSGRLGLQFH